MITYLLAVRAYLTDVIPNPAPVAPPGADSIMQAVANVKWGAGVALAVGFLTGLAVWAGGRWVDHHRAGRIGLIMMMCALAGGIAYAIGPELINHFAGN
jgi:hypothetical protein